MCVDPESTDETSRRILTFWKHPTTANLILVLGGSSHDLLPNGLNGLQMTVTNHSQANGRILQVATIIPGSFHKKRGSCSAKQATLTKLSEDYLFITGNYKNQVFISGSFI